MIVQQRDMRAALDALLQRRASRVAVVVLEETTSFLGRMLGWGFDLALKLTQCASIFYVLLLLGRSEYFAGLAPQQVALLRAWGEQFAPEVHLLWIWCVFGLEWLFGYVGRLAATDAPALSRGEKDVMRRYAVRGWTLAPLSDCWLALGPGGEELPLRGWAQVVRRLAELEGDAHA